MIYNYMDYKAIYDEADTRLKEAEKARNLLKLNTNWNVVKPELCDLFGQDRSITDDALKPILLQQYEENTKNIDDHDWNYYVDKVIESISKFRGEYKNVLESKTGGRIRRRNF